MYFQVTAIRVLCPWRSRSREHFGGSSLWPRFRLPLIIWRVLCRFFWRPRRFRCHFPPGRTFLCKRCRNLHGRVCRLSCISESLLRSLANLLWNSSYFISIFQSRGREHKFKDERLSDWVFTACLACGWFLPVLSSLLPRPTPLSHYSSVL